MSGIVNRTVAERAIEVKADESIRKPFQPQDLIARVKSLLNPAGASPAKRSSLREEDANSSQAASRVLSGLFSPPPAPQYGAPQKPAPANSRLPIPSPPPHGPNRTRGNICAASQRAPRVSRRLQPSSNARQPRHLQPKCKSCVTKSAASNCS